MTTNATDILAYLNKNYPQQEFVSVKNWPDINIETAVKLQTQFIFGVTNGDPFTPGISYYEEALKKKLNGKFQQIKCYPTAFERQQIPTMKTTLVELAEKLGVDLDPEKMIKKLNINEEGSGLYYIVVTIVQYPVVYAGSRT